MRKSLHLALAASVVAVGVVAAIQFHERRAEVPTATADPPLSASAGNTATISELKDDRAYRDRQLRVDGSVVEGDGVAMPAPGVLEFTSFNGVKLSQRLTGATLVAGKARRSLARASTAPVAGGDANRSSVRFAGFFDGLDLEYRYDGRDVEEFFHVSDALKAEIVGDGADVELTALFPGLTRAKTYLRPSEPARAPGPEELLAGGRPPPPDLRPPHERPLEGTETVELYANLGRFLLPPAVLRDDAGHEQRLSRRFEYTDDGLEVRVHVPAALIKESTGRVVIDPSIIDSQRQIEISGWSAYGYSIVRSSNGNLHVVYAAVYNGSWSVAYSRSSNGGISWTSPSIAFQGDNTIFDVQPPTIAIDSNDTIHAVWATYGQVNSDSDSTARTYAMLMRYARCSNGCVVPNWRFQGSDGGKILTPSFGTWTYQYNAHLAIDRDNMAHIMFMNCASGCNSQYITVSSDEVVDDSRPAPTNNWYYGLFIDAQNTPQVLTTNYRCDSSICGSIIVNLSFKPSIGDWEESPTTMPTLGRTFANSNCNSNYGWAYNLTGSVGPDGGINLAMGLYVDCAPYGYYPAYVKFDPVNKVFSGATFVDRPASTSGTWVWTRPVVTVDRSNVPYVVWTEQSSRTNIFLSRRNAGVSSFTPRELLARASNASEPKVLCSKYWPESMRGVDGNKLDMGVFRTWVTLRYGVMGDTSDPTQPSGSRRAGVLLKSIRPSRRVENHTLNTPFSSVDSSATRRLTSAPLM